jgi:prepilin-type processing-associated H-X9-DG protein
VAIISILAAILFPVFARARDNARRASCISNLKQIGLGVMMYVQDYDERFPGGYYGVPAGTVGPDGKIYWDGVVFWEQMIYPYVKNHQVFFCPSSAQPFSVPTSETGATSPYANTLNGNYGMNGLIATDGTSNVPNMASVSSPASTYLFMEFGIYSFQPYYVLHPSGTYYLPGVGNLGESCSSVTDTASTTFKSDCESGRHFGGVTVGFADGHVKWLKSSVVLKEANRFLTGPPVNGGVSAFNPKTDNSE